MKFIALYYTLYSILGIFILNIGCTQLQGEDDKLTLDKRPYVGKELRLDGYYYQVMQTGHWRVYFLYRDGIILHADDFLPDRLEEKEETFRNGQCYEIAKKYKIDWGVFHIDSNEIKFEKWFPSDGGPLPVYISVGNILNDSTFHISKTQRSNGSEQAIDKDWLFHFRPFSPKPDSICPFIP